MRRRRLTAQFVCVIVAILCACIGCGDSPSNYRPLPRPAAEIPAANPPVQIRQKNWLGPNNEGSCVHASTVSMLRWLNQFELASDWRNSFGGGEYSSRLRERMDAAKIKYGYTEQANLALLDFAHDNRRMALLWWKPNHCCNFCGWVNDSAGRTWAVILDNNFPDRYEFVEQGQFHRLWAGYGGFALSVIGDSPPPRVYRSFERVYR